MKPFTTAAVILLAIVAVLQLVRFILSWDVIVNGITIPIWVSGIAFVVAATLAVMLRREARP